MCDSCRQNTPVKVIKLAASAVDAAGDLRFWRELTPIELEFGDIERVSTEINDSEVAIATAAANPLRDILRDIVAAATAAVKAGDFEQASKIERPDTAELESALKSAIGAAIDTGKKQVFDQYRKQKGEKLALPPRLKPKLVAKYLRAKSVTESDRLVHAAIDAAQKMAMSQLGRGIAVDSAAIEKFVVSTTEKLLEEISRDDAREANAAGRRIAAEDTANEIESVVYTAILDTNVCDSCEELDGDEYGPEEMGKAPNPDCEGALYAGCRCAELIIYKKG